MTVATITIMTTRCRVRFRFVLDVRMRVSQSRQSSCVNQYYDERLSTAEDVQPKRDLVGRYYGR